MSTIVQAIYFVLTMDSTLWIPYSTGGNSVLIEIVTVL